MSGEVIVLEGTGAGANGPLAGSLEGGRFSLSRGEVAEFGLSTADFLLKVYREGRGVIRFSRPTDRVIPAPKYHRRSWSVDDVMGTKPGEPARHLHARALELMLSTSALPEGDLTWERYAARLVAEERNAQSAAELQKASEALAEARLHPAKQEERELEEAEAAAAAARERLKKVKAVQVKQTREELEEEVQQSEAQIKVFEAASVEPKKIEASHKRLTKAQKALAERTHEDQGVASRALLEPLLAQFDSLPADVAALVRPHVEAAQAALADGTYEQIAPLAQQIRTALTPQVKWTTETRPAWFGPTVWG